VQGSEQDMQFFATQELQRQNLHRGLEATPHSQAWAQQNKSETSRPLHTTLFAPRFHPMGGSFTQKGHGVVKSLNSIQDEYAVEDMRFNTVKQAHVGLLADGCGKMAEFLAQAPWDERRVGLGTTHLGIEQHLHSQNSICHRLTLMMEDLPTEAIPTAEGEKLQQLHRILQLSRMLDWPGECLQSEISTLEFDLVISEIAEFETLRLGFLHTIKETILTVYDKLTNPNMTELTNHLPQLAHLLDIKQALTWIQYKLLEESTHSIIQLATLQATFGSLGDIAEIFLFEPRSEGFIIFYGSLQIPNFDGILSPHHGLIMIKNPSYPFTSDLIHRSAPLPNEETTHRHTHDTIRTRPRPTRSHGSSHRAEPLADNSAG